jgi:hypothetical protein
VKLESVSEIGTPPEYKQSNGYRTGQQARQSSGAVREESASGELQMMEKRYEINWEAYGERKIMLWEKIWRIREMENLPCDVRVVAIN